MAGVVSTAHLFRPSTSITGPNAAGSGRFAFDTFALAALLRAVLSFSKLSKMPETRCPT